jgi:endonuclease/exonuclease/phosphatase family metal-dependent hydrolase
MPIYNKLFNEFSAKGDEARAERAARGLLKLRNQLRRELPPRNLDESLLLASWNLREFGRNQKYGPRMPEAIQYIAEVMAHFDLIAVQEIHQNLGDLVRLMQTLGPWWTYIVTDVTPGRSGNQERMAFVFDTRKIIFDHLAGELVLPQQGKLQRQQPARSPFICAFRAGWRRVSVCCVHIYYGTKDPNDPSRVAEIDAIAGLLAKRNFDRQSMADGEPDNVILLGDFNIFNQEGDETTAALERNGFVVPKGIRLLKRNKYYDQIAFHDPRNRLRSTTKAGVFDFSDSVFTEDEAAGYDMTMAQLAPAAYAKATSKQRLYREWRTFQMSDHLPLWLELKIDFANNYLAVRGRLHKSRGVKSNTDAVVAVSTRKGRQTERPALGTLTAE